MTTPAERNRALNGLTAVMQREFTRIWFRLNLNDPDVLRDPLAAVLEEIADKYGTASAALAADFYDDMREDVVRSGARFTPKLAEVPGPERFTSLAGWGIGPLFGGNPDPTTALHKINGGLTLVVGNTYRETIMGSSIADPAARGWQRVADANACGFCLMLEGRGSVFSESSADFASHDHCVPGGTVVDGPLVELGFRRWYEGEVVEIRTANRKLLTVTPNHPILTPRGWVAAGELCASDDVFESAGSDLRRLSVPDENYVPSSIEDVWGAAGMDLLRSVPVSPQDFHGDFGLRQSDVEVVASDRFLADVVDTAIAECLTQVVASGTGRAAVARSFAALGDLDSMRFGLGCPAHGSMSSSSLSASLLWAHSASSDSRRLGRTSDWQTGLTEPTGNGRPRNAESFGHRQNAFASQIDGLEIVGRFDAIMASHGGPGSRFHALPNERLTDPLGRTSTQRASDLIERLAGGVQRSGIVELSRRYSSGHVFNLQTSEGWYTANSLVVSNCGCTAEPAFEGEPIPVQPYTPSERRVSDVDRARAREWIKANL